MTGPALLTGYVTQLVVAANYERIIFDLEQTPASLNLTDRGTPARIMWLPVLTDLHASQSRFSELARSSRPCCPPLALLAGSA